MTLVLDSGGVSALATSTSRLAKVRLQYGWPAVVPAVVLTETLTGDRRRDHAVNGLLSICIVAPVDETKARWAARLRTATGRAATISAPDAIVAAVAADVPDPIVITSAPRDLAALAAQVAREITVMPV